jgi:hypothetical protein
MADSFMIIAKIGHPGYLYFTGTPDHLAATGMERAATDSLEGAGNATFYRNQPLFGCTGYLWDSLK